MTLCHESTIPKTSALGLIMVLYFTRLEFTFDPSVGFNSNKVNLLIVQIEIKMEKVLFFFF